MPGGILIEDVEVIDGDTVAIDGPQGERLRVRIIGIDTPETARGGQPAQCWAEEATRALRERIEHAEEVRLIPDPRVGERDRYGRLLRQVVVDGVDVGEQLVAEGHAQRFAAVPAGSRVHDRYRWAEQRARSAGAGLWGSCASAG
jgi:micrococcal nuclease